MLVHLGAWSEEPGNALAQLDSIVEVLHENNIGIARNWVGQYQYRTSKEVLDNQMDWRYAEDENEASLARADAYIAEVTSYRLYHGYELANALSQNKPVLLLANKPFKQFAISGVDNRLLHLYEYKSMQDLQSAVVDFINKVNVPRDRKEVTVPVSQELYHYLADKSRRSHKTDGELIQDLAEDGLKYRKLIEDKQ